MKKTLAFITILLTLFNIFAFSNVTFAANNVTQNTSQNTSSNVIDEKTESKIVEIKKKESKSLEDYKEKYGSDAYGIAAYILNILRVYSIPFCFLGIAIGAIYQYIIGIRKLDTQEKGMGLIVSFITIFIICQVLPLAFVLVVKMSGD